MLKLVDDVVPSASQFAVISRLAAANQLQFATVTQAATLLNQVAAHVVVASFLQDVLMVTVPFPLKVRLLLQRLHQNQWLLLLLQLSLLQHQQRLKMLLLLQQKKLQLPQQKKLQLPQKQHQKLQRTLLQRRKSIGTSNLHNAILWSCELSKQVAGMSPVFMRRL